MKSIIKLSIVLLACILLGCGSEESVDDPISFVVYGTVVDKVTGEPVGGAEISFHTSIYSSSVGSSIPNGSVGSSVTGMDGHYEMHCTVTKNLMVEIRDIYSLYIEAYGHKPYSKELTISVVEGMKVQQDAAI